MGMTLVARLKKRLYFGVAGYFKFFANVSLRRWRPRVIAITGSAGKTTMLGLVETQLGVDAHYSHNANGLFGISFDVLGLSGVTGSKLKWLHLVFAAPLRAFSYRRQEKIYVVEIDGERPREAEMIARWLRPEVTVWVSLGVTHAVYFEQEVASGRFASHAEAIAHEFAMIPKYTRKLTIVDGDNAMMMTTLNDVGTRSQVKMVSRKRVDGYEVRPDAAEFRMGGKAFRFEYPMPQDVSIQLVMLVKLMNYLGRKVDYDLPGFTLSPGRNNPLVGKKGLKIIDSSYNAHIVSVVSVLDMMKHLKNRPKWLVMGDIVEQGSLEKVEHERLVELICAANLDMVVLVGRRTAKYTYPLLKGKLSVVSFEKPRGALAYLEKHLTGKETITFKGSQYLEWIIEKLLNDPEDAALLARQDVAHRRRREKWRLT